MPPIDDDDQIDDQIDMAFISESEGGQQLTGYIPDAADDSSGVTVATGVDLGQLTDEQLEALDISPELRDRLEPYVGLTGDEAAAFLVDNPLDLDSTEAEALDRAVLNPIIDAVSTSYDNSGADAVFSTLPSEARTVIADVAVQYGEDLANRTPKFWSDVTEGRWQDAVDELRDFGDNFPTRRNREADLLQQAIDNGALPSGDLGEHSHLSQKEGQQLLSSDSESTRA